MYQHLTDWETHAENMQISVCFCKTCICLKNLENIQISVNMINRLDITDEYSVKCDFILNTVTFIDAALNISLRKLWKCNVLWFYLFGQGVPNETKGTINLKTFQYRLVWTCIHKKLITCHSPNFKICVGSKIILPVTLLQPTKTDDRKRSNLPPDVNQIVFHWPPWRSIWKFAARGYAKTKSIGIYDIESYI